MDGWRVEKKNERVLGVARTIKKRASAQILAGSKLPEKRNNRWIRPLSAVVTLPLGFHPPPLRPGLFLLSKALLPPPLAEFQPRLVQVWLAREILGLSFSRVKNPLDEERAAVSDKKLAGVANVSTLNHIFIATLIQPF